MCVNNSLEDKKPCHEHWREGFSSSPGPSSPPHTQSNQSCQVLTHAVSKILRARKHIENWNHPPMRLKMFTKTCELESHGLPGLHLNALWRQRFHNPFLMRLQLFRGNKVRAGSHDRNRSKWSPYRLALPQNSCCTPTNKWRSDAHKCMLSIYIET